MNKSFILDIPGELDDPSTELGKFLQAISPHTRFRPGRRMGSAGGLGSILHFPEAVEDQFPPYTQTERGYHDVIDGKWWIELVTPKALSHLEDAFNNAQVDYVCHPQFYALCCDESTATSKALFAFNFHGEKLLFVSSPNSFFYVSARARIKEYTPYDEQFERALIEEDIRMTKEDTNCEHPPTVLELFDSMQTA